MSTRLIVCSIFDSAIQAYSNPVLVPARGAALRSFVDEVNRPTPDGSNPLAGHPEDYELRVLAEFDPATGIYHNLPEGIEVIARGKDVKRTA